MVVDFSFVLLFGVVFFALLLFLKEVFPVDVTAILVMVLLMLLRLVTPEEGISGFSNHAVITILAMFILSAGVERTGLIHLLSVRVFGFVGSNELLQLVVVMLLVAPLSGFLNNAAIVAILLPFVMNLSKVSKTSPSKLLIPLSYVSMSAGMLTIIGTSTNLLTNSILQRYEQSPETAHLDLAPFSMFEFWKIGSVVLALTMVYFLLIGYWLLPRRKSEEVRTAVDGQKFTFELRIPVGSDLAGMMIKDSILRKRYKVQIIKLKRGRKRWKEGLSKKILREGDVLTVKAVGESLFNLESEPSVEVLVEDLQKKAKPEETLKMIVPQGSRFIGRKVEDLHLDVRYKAAVMAVSKGLKTITGPLENVRLDLGDMLLVKTTSEHLEKLEKNRNLLIIDYVESSYRKDKRTIALLIVSLVVVVAALGFYPIVVTSLAGAVVMILAGVLTSEEAYRSVRWEVIFLLAGLIPLGIALENSGATAIIVNGVSFLALGLPVYWVLVGFYVFTTVFTEVVSNNASVILLVPIGIELAVALGFNPYLLVLVIMFAASTSFLTPVGYKTNTMVYGTGVYRFSDFFRAGFLLNLILAFVTPQAIIWIWA
jgi:di/tricarboxylate transporter